MSRDCNCIFLDGAAMRACEPLKRRLGLLGIRVFCWKLPDAMLDEYARKLGCKVVSTDKDARTGGLSYHYRSSHVKTGAKQQQK